MDLNLDLDNLFNPHRFTWGFMYSFPVAAVIAVPL